MTGATLDCHARPRGYQEPPPVPPVDAQLTEAVSGRIGEYEILRRIGDGGMGEVFEAVHSVIGKHVAIKVLLHEYVSRPEVAPQLLAEARAVNQVRHRNLVDVSGFGELPDGRQYIVMEQLEGETLHTAIARRGRLELEEGLD